MSGWDRAASKELVHAERQAESLCTICSHAGAKHISLLPVWEGAIVLMFTLLYRAFAAAFALRERRASSGPQEQKRLHTMIHEWAIYALLDTQVSAAAGEFLLTGIENNSHQTAEMSMLRR